MCCKKDTQIMRRTHCQEELLRCPGCANEFIQNRPWQRFCSISCRRKYHRTESRRTIILGMVATARALGYSRDEFILKIGSIWKWGSGRSTEIFPLKYQHLPSYKWLRRWFYTLFRCASIQRLIGVGYYEKRVDKNEIYVDDDFHYERRQQEVERLPPPKKR